MISNKKNEIFNSVWKSDVGKEICFFFDLDSWIYIPTKLKLNRLVQMATAPHNDRG